MAKYRIVISKKVRKDFKSIAKRDASRILAEIEKLGEDPRPADTKKLKGEELYRIRVGNFRVIYEIRDGELIVIVVRVGNRKDVYR